MSAYRYKNSAGKIYYLHVVHQYIVSFLKENFWLFTLGTLYLGSDFAKRCIDVSHLHHKLVTLKGGRKQNIYYFARDIREGALDKTPRGYRIIETKRSGLPVLKRRK